MSAVARHRQHRQSAGGRRRSAAGRVNGLSFGYRARSFTRDEAGRDLRDIDLFEVSLVTNPMQHGARVHMIA
jgi:phage head maturation protease